MKKLIVLILALMIIGSAAAASAETRIRMASTTSTQNSGLFDYLLPIFEKKTGIHIDVVAVGTGVLVAVGGTGVFVADGPGVFVGVRVGVLVGPGVLVGGTGVFVGVFVGGTGVFVAVGGGPALQPENLNEPICVDQAQPPLLLYSLVYQKVQSSVGSTVIAL